MHVHNRKTPVRRSVGTANQNRATTIVAWNFNVKPKVTVDGSRRSRRRADTPLGEHEHTPGTCSSEGSLRLLRLLRRLSTSAGTRRVLFFFFTTSSIPQRGGEGKGKAFGARPLRDFGESARSMTDTITLSTYARRNHRFIFYVHVLSSRVFVCTARSVKYHAFVETIPKPQRGTLSISLYAPYRATIKSTPPAVTPSILSCIIEARYHRIQ